FGQLVALRIQRTVPKRGTGHASCLSSCATTRGGSWPLRLKHPRRLLAMSSPRFRHPKTGWPGVALGLEGPTYLCTNIARARPAISRLSMGIDTLGRVSLHRTTPPRLDYIGLMTEMFHWRIIWVALASSILACAYRSTGPVASRAQPGPPAP